MTFGHWWSERTYQLRQWLGRSVSRRVTWVTDARRDALGDLSSDFALVTVIGREHYEQHQRRYPIRRESDLRRVLSLEFPSSDGYFFRVGPLVGEEREVTVFHLRPSCPKSSLRSLFWVPETLIVTSLTQSSEVLTIDRDGCRYFVSPTGASMVAGGVIQSPALFALSVGMAVDSSHRVIDATGVRGEMARALSRLTLADWWGFRSPLSSDKIRDFLVPAAVVSTVLLTVYLGLASAYLWSMQWWRSQEMVDLGPEVTSLIAQQRAVDLLGSERSAISELLSGSQPAWPIWQLVEVIWRASGTVYSITLGDDTVSIRCKAPDATAVLKALQAVPGFKDVQFDAAVRQAAGGQEFVVTLVRVSNIVSASR